jgi:hypothetical protein
LVSAKFFVDLKRRMLQANRLFGLQRPPAPK